ncbi:AAA family ATPase [Gemmatimonas sp.]|uniref:ATP-binding protein n=1 Tax=Gemmatimonas sp. TaxID=1962908 RepID=UPI0025BE4390|nr:AAA family ATPase [Gemmatimonas sp.]MCA2985485.1 AAA family ATPase [Gemmatimonas sp.]
MPLSSTLPDLTDIASAVPDTDEDALHAVSIQLQTLGASRVLLGEQVLGMHNALLFLLVLRMAYTPGMAVARDTLVQEFWPDQEESRQRGNLRQALYKLRTMGVRTALRGDVVHLDPTQVRRNFALAPSADHFDRDITRGTEPYGSFLPGVTPPTALLQEWLDVTRETLHGAMRRVLVDVLRQRRERADWKGTQMVAAWLLQLDPLNEDATLALAECAALSGSKAEAVAILDRYLQELGPAAGDIRLPATLLRRRFVEAPTRRRAVALVTDKHFHGRDVELSEHTMSLRRARWHDGSAVLLHGPPGMGKTRLMLELLKVAQVEGYREVVMECRESITTRPLGALIEALPDLLSAPGAAGCAPESLTVLRKLLGPNPMAVGTEEAAEAAEADPVSHDALSVTERVELAIRTMRAQSIRHAVVDLFAAVSEERPIFLLAEDVNWLDDASWEVLADVIQRVNEMRVYIVLTSRFATIREERPARLPTPLTYRRLLPLTEDALVSLVRGAADEHGVSVPEDVERWIIRGCEGNPLMLRALLEHWHVTGTSGGVPPSLSALLDQRIDRLDARAQHTLHTVSLLASLATLERIKLVLELPAHELIHSIEQLELSGCLMTGLASVVITHDLVRQVSLRRMSPLVEAALRASIADALESEYLRTADLTVLLEALTHTSRSGRPDVLYRFFMNHDEALIRGDRPSTVLGAIEILLEDVPRSRTEPRIARLQLNQESQNGASSRALSLLPKGLRLPVEVDSLPETELDVCLSFAEAAYRSSPTTDPRTLAGFAANVAKSHSPSLDQRIRAADIGLLIASNTCDPKVAEDCYLGLQLSDEYVRLNERTQKLGLTYHTVFGSVDVAVSIADELVRRNTDSRSTAQRVVECGRAGFVYRIIGSTSAAVGALNRAREVALEIDSPRLAEYPIWQLAQLALENGDMQSAQRWTKELRQLGESNADDAANNYIHAHLCLMAIAEEDSDEAALQCERVIRTISRTRPLRTLAYAAGLELGVGLMNKKWRPSAAQVATAVSRFSQSSGYCASDFLASRIGESLIRLNRLEDAVGILGEYMQRTRRERSAPTAFLRPVLYKLKLLSTAH